MRAGHSWSSDWPALREVFPHAVHVPNTRAGIAFGVRVRSGSSTHSAAAAELRGLSRSGVGVSTRRAAGEAVD
jgi:hypothetical protein